MAGHQGARAHERLWQMTDLGGRLEALTRTVLDASWRQGVQAGRPYAFTAPSPRRYPWQWYWDSCFSAIVRRRWDPARARRERRTSTARCRCRWCWCRKPRC